MTTIVQVEIKDTETAKSVASGLIHKGGLTPSKGFSVDPPGGLEVFGEDHGWIFNVDEEQAAVIRYWIEP